MSRVVGAAGARAAAQRVEAATRRRATEPLDAPHAGVAHLAAPGARSPRASSVGSPPPTRQRSPSSLPSSSSSPSRDDASSSSRASGPKRRSAVAVVKSFSTEAGIRGGVGVARVERRSRSSGRAPARRHGRARAGDARSSDARSALRVERRRRGNERKEQRERARAARREASGNAHGEARYRATAAICAGRRPTRIGLRESARPGTAARLRRLHGGMGKVVNLDQAQGRAAAKRSAARPRRRGPRRSKTALVLGGGGFTGGVYEIGALRALDLLAVNRTVNEFDVYVGTSAGSFVAALAANGITPEEMMRVVNQQVPTPFRDIDVGTRAAAQPARVRQDRRAAAAGALREARPRRSRRSGATSARWTSRSASPRTCRPASTPAPGIENYVRDGPLGPRPHRRLPRCSTTSSTSRRPTSTPASGSSSAPTAGTTCRSRRAVARLDRAADGLQARRGPRPRARRRRHHLDDERRHRGRARARSSSIVVNPLVPYVNDFTKEIPTPFGTRAAPRQRHGPRRRSATRRSSCSPTSACTRWRAQWEQKYPGVDILLIEPEPDDELMFQTSIMDFTKRVEIARHGFQSVTLKLAEDYDTLQGDRSAATASRSPPRACARSSSTSPARRRRRGPGAASSSRRPARCCASRRPRTTTAADAAPSKKASS